MFGRDAVPWEGTSHLLTAGYTHSASWGQTSTTIKSKTQFSYQSQPTAPDAGMACLHGENWISHCSWLELPCTESDELNSRLLPLWFPPQPCQCWPQGDEPGGELVYLSGTVTHLAFLRHPLSAQKAHPDKNREAGQEPSTAGHRSHGFALPA